MKGWSNREKIDRKALDQIRGFLVYVTMTYGALTLYLKGLHLTLESWREDCDADGWRMTPSKLALVQRDRGQLSDIFLSGEESTTPPPAMVVPVPRFNDDVNALAQLTSMEKPPHVSVRPKSSAAVALMF
ncbi:hypothetical protein ACA910_000905 [Epithemia clementina (nom. ined.)]